MGEKTLSTMESFSSMTDDQIKAMEEQIDLAHKKGASQTHRKYYISQLVVFCTIPTLVIYCYTAYNFFWANPNMVSIDPNDANVVISAGVTSVTLSLFPALVYSAITAGIINMIHGKDPNLLIDL
jgi:hypothetical protein